MLNWVVTNTLTRSVNLEGQKELLGMWLSENEGAKFWLNVVTELENRGVKDILIACVDDLKGFPDAINTVYPDTHIQLCIVHMVRNSMKFVPWKDYKAIAANLKAIYQATTEEKALLSLDQFSERWAVDNINWQDWRTRALRLLHRRKKKQTLLLNVGRDGCTACRLMCSYDLTFNFIIDFDQTGKLYKGDYYQRGYYKRSLYHCCFPICI